MKTLSINASLPRLIEMHGKPVLTGIYKEPVAGAVPLHRLGLEGDGQADHSVHGGEHQAIYSYPFEHYAHWQEYLRRDSLPYGTFGENLTTLGLLETEVCIGDTFRVGSAILQVTAPRLPCFKFAHKMGYPAILKDFLRSGRSGFYFRVLQEGTLRAGDEWKPLDREPQRITMRQMLGLQRLGEGGAAELRRALLIDNLNPPLRAELAERLASDLA